MIGLLIGAIIISFSPVMVVLAGLPPEVAAFYRLFGGGLGLLVVLAKQGKLKLFTPHVLKWGLFGGVFFAGDFTFWHRSIGYVGPGLSTMLGSFQIIPLALVSALFFKERLSPKLIIGIPLALIGLYLMVGVQWGTFTADYQIGVIFGLLAACFYALYLLSLKYALARDRADTMVMAAAVAIITGLLQGGSALAQGESFGIPSLESLVAIVTLALVCHAVGWLLITQGIRTERGALVGLVLLLQPMLSFVWDLLFFDKPVVVVELVGVGVALLGIYIGSLKSCKEQSSKLLS
ncbi:DMT family transporter [uncultured Pseudodesulfovibrio sp.]|uniref:DMT family transporter n=1 Tax=uncultured Pseudodesulfovibrio sp. TaxID=2035858 RepID=UPI0029C831EA|nr:DMT family transporter [uncultured Pseudodesulfovibrio sp.]